VKNSKAATDTYEFISRSGVASASLLPAPADSPRTNAIPPKTAPVAEQKQSEKPLENTVESPKDSKPAK
jgi:hypothetical protein